MLAERKQMQPSAAHGKHAYNPPLAALPTGYPPLRPFIRWLLAPLSLAEATLDRLTDDEGMRLFQRAFTHETFDARFDHNSERLEWVGDTLVNDAVASYIYRKFPWTQGWMTLIKHRVIQTHGLGQLAQNLRFLPHVRVSRAKRAQVENSEKKKMELLEDAFEAFIGACREAFVAKGAVLCPAKYPRAGAMMGTALVEELLFRYLDAPHLIAIASDWETVKDAKSRAKEFYSAQRWTELPKVLKTRKVAHNHFVATLPAWPRGKAVYYEAGGATAGEAEQNVAKRAMDDLTRTYKMREHPKPRQHDAKLKRL